MYKNIQKVCCFLYMIYKPIGFPLRIPGFSLLAVLHPGGGITIISEVSIDF